MTSGWTPQGYLATTATEEVDNLNALILTNVDQGLDLDPDQPWGQIIGSFSQEYADLTELLATVYNMLNPAAAEDQFLVNIALLSGTVAQQATFSTVIVQMSLNASTTVHAGATMAVANQPQNTWVLTADVVSIAAGYYNGVFRSAQPGPFVALAGTLTVITTPTSGWTAGTNVANAVEGLAQDTNTTLRQKIVAERSGQGSGDVDAIRAALLTVPGVISAFVFENSGWTVDANGVPPKAIHAVIWDGPSPLASNATLASTIWTQKDGGIQAYGGTTVAVTSSSGQVVYVSFDRAVQIPIYVTCTTTPSVLTSDQRQAVVAALSAYAVATFLQGVSIIDLPFRAAALVTSAGITDVPTFAFDVHATPTNTANISIPYLSIATLTDGLGHISINGVVS